MEEPSDHELMLAVRAGEISRLGDLFERHHRPLYGFLARLIGDRESAEDLVQIVFQRIHKYRHTYRDEGKFSAWIYHLARHVAADHHRRNARQGTATDPSDFDRVSDDTTPTAEAAASRLDDLKVMKRALQSLPPEQREVLILPRETSPLVQVAMIDFVIASRDEGAAATLDALTRNPATDAVVREAARRGLVRLGIS